MRCRLALLLVLVLAIGAAGCGKKGGEGGGGGTPAVESGSGGCVVPFGETRLCGDDAIDWCRAHPGGRLTAGDCEAVLPKPVQPKQDTTARTPTEDTSGGASAPPSSGGGASGSGSSGGEETPQSSSGGGTDESSSGQAVSCPSSRAVANGKCLPQCDDAQGNNTGDSAYGGGYPCGWYGRVFAGPPQGSGDGEATGSG